MVKLAALALTVLLLIQTGCSSPSEVEEPGQVLIVQAYLTPGEDARVAVRRTLPPERYYDGLEDTVSAATVSIAVDGETFTLSEDGAEPGTYWIGADLMPVVSGRTYELTVSAAGLQARAATTVPGAPRITEITADTIVYYQHYADLFGDLVHPGEFRWTRPDGVVGYVVIVEATEVRSVGEWALPLTADLDTLLARREALDGLVSADSLAALDLRIDELRRFFSRNVSLTRADGTDLRWLRDRDQEDWDEIDGKDWSEGRKWREKIDGLFYGRVIDYWVPADSTRGDYWWMGVRFEGEYRVRLQAADRNYFDYYTTAFNGQSGNDGDRGPLFNVESGLGVFGSYAEESFLVHAARARDGTALRIVASRE